MKIIGMDGEEFRQEAMDAADMLMAAALPHALETPLADASCRMAAGIALVAMNAQARLKATNAGEEQVETFYRSFGGAMGFVAMVHGPDAAILAIHYMLDYVAAKGGPSARSRVLTGVAAIHLEEVLKGRAKPQ